MKHDVTVTKNYLSQKELSDLNIEMMYLDNAESQAKKCADVYETLSRVEVG